MMLQLVSRYTNSAQETVCRDTCALLHSCAWLDCTPAFLDSDTGWVYPTMHFLVHCFSPFGVSVRYMCIFWFTADVSSRSLEKMRMIRRFLFDLVAAWKIPLNMQQQSARYTSQFKRKKICALCRQRSTLNLMQTPLNFMPNGELKNLSKHHD